MEAKIVEIASAFQTEVPVLWESYVYYVWIDSLTGIFGCLGLGVGVFAAGVLGVKKHPEPSFKEDKVLYAATSGLVSVLAAFIILGFTITGVQNNLTGVLAPQGKAISRALSE